MWQTILAMVSNSRPQTFFSPCILLLHNHKQAGGFLLKYSSSLGGPLTECISETSCIGGKGVGANGETAGNVAERTGNSCVGCWVKYKGRIPATRFGEMSGVRGKLKAIVGMYEMVGDFTDSPEVDEEVDVDVLLVAATVIAVGNDSDLSFEIATLVFGTSLLSILCRAENDFERKFSKENCTFSLNNAGNWTESQ